MGQLADLPNIGKVLEQQLEEVGIHTEEDLKRIGAEQIWLRIQRIDESASGSGGSNTGSKEKLSARDS